MSENRYVIMAALALAGGVQVCGGANVLAERVLPSSMNRISYTAVYNAVNKADAAADLAWLGLNSVAEYERHCLELRKGMLNAIGPFPEKCDLNVRTVSTIQRDGYKVEKVIFDSVPGMPITALMYLPTDPKFKPPYSAFVVSCGHSNNGKGDSGYQRACVLGAKAGMAALIYDPIAQGERMQVPDTANVHGHNRLGALAALLGDSMARFRIWDGMRAMDYLDSRADVVHGSYGLMGNSGGGTMTSLIMAVDRRVKAACPSCYLSSIRDVYSQMGPQDAEQNIYGQLAFALNHASLVLMGGNAVNVCCCHDDMFPFSGSLATWRVVRQVDEKLGFGRYGMTDVPGPHGWKESIRVASVEWMREKVGGESRGSVDAENSLHLLSPPTLSSDIGFDLAKADAGLKDFKVVANGKIAELPGFRSAYDILRDELAATENVRKTLSHDEKARKAVELAGIGKVKLVSEERVGGESRWRNESGWTNEIMVTKHAFVFSDGIAVPVVVFEKVEKVENVERVENVEKKPQPSQPSQPTQPSQPIILVSDGSKEDWSDVVNEKLREGHAVLVADLIGSGEIGTAKHSFYGAKNADEEVAVMLYALGRSLVGVRADELLAIANFANRRYSAKAEVVARGRMAIPAAHVVAANRALFSKVSMENPPLGWAEAVKTSAKYPFANVVNSALKFYDWTDLTGL